jgi:hypothetical protein
MNFVTITDLARRPTEVVLGFEQHADPADLSFGAAVLRVRCNPALNEPAYFPPCTADPDLPLVLLPDGWLTHGALRRWPPQWASRSTWSCPLLA